MTIASSLLTGRTPREQWLNREWTPVTANVGQSIERGETPFASIRTH